MEGVFVAAVRPSSGKPPAVLSPSLLSQERVELQQRAEAEFARERAMVDEVVARIQAEDRMHYEARKAKQAETKV
jgi:hypothetical protein